MAEYKGIKGFKTQSLAADPPVGVEGQVWYNTTSSALKFTSASGTWSSSNALPLGNYTGAYAGIQTAGLFFGGDYGPSGPARITKASLTYDGTSWTAGNSMVDDTKHQARSGTQTSALSICGVHPGTVLCESYNGTCWSNSTSTNTARAYAGGGGASNTSALTYGGPQLDPTMTANTETWNGSAWTEVNNLNTPLSLMCSDGIVTSAMAAGGKRSGPPTYSVNTETWDGTSWTENAGDLNTGTIDGGGAGNSTAFLAQGGGVDPGYSVKTEEWDGTSWTEMNNMATARASYNAAGGTTSLSLVAGGQPTTNVVEEWTVGPTTKTVTVS